MYLQLIGFQEIKHFADTVAKLLLARHVRRMNIEDTRADMTRVGLVHEDLEELGIVLAILNAEHIGIQGSDGVEEVLELEVAEMRVDLRPMISVPALPLYS
jgi:hypothetical protein